MASYSDRSPAERMQHRCMQRVLHMHAAHKCNALVSKRRQGFTLRAWSFYFQCHFRVFTFTQPPTQSKFRHPCVAARNYIEGDIESSRGVQQQLVAAESERKVAKFVTRCAKGLSCTSTLMSGVTFLHLIDGK
jgi:hypothetical protein